MKKKLFIFTVSALCAAALAGCGNSNSQGAASYIGVDAAKNMALSAANQNAENVIFSQAELSEDNGIVHYEVEFSSNGTEYSYSIDAMTGAVIEEKKEAQDGQTQITAQSLTNDSQQQTTGNSQQTGDIGEAKAKEIALNHAGVSESAATFALVKKDFDDGIYVYEVEFYVASTATEYDYEINASTGAVISYDHDAENYTPQQQTGTAKTKEEVINIALARVPGATANDIMVSQDRDDGKLVYEGKIVYNQNEYEFTIDAYSGAILEWEAESIFD